MHVNDLLKIAVESGASDLHLKVGSYPMMRVRGTLVPANEERRLEHDDMEAFASAVLPTAQRQILKEHHESTSPTACRGSAASAPTPSVSAGPPG